MPTSPTHRRRARVSPARRALPILIATLALGAASSSPAASALSFQPQLGLPGGVSMFGASPGQAPGEVWATASIGAVPATADGRQIKDAAVLLRHAQGSGWQIVPVLDVQGASLDFAGTPQATYNGGVAMLGAGSSTILTHDPTGAFEQAPIPEACSKSPCTSGPPGAVLEKGESLSDRLAAIDEESGHTGALIVPEHLSSAAPGVLHYDGTQWTREPICTLYTVGATEPCAHATGLTARALAASSPRNAWLLATGTGGSLLLFKRTVVAGSDTPVWELGGPASWAPSGDTVSARTSGQMLTVTSQGVWVDAALRTPAVHKADLSLLLDASSPSTVLGTWCYPQSTCGQGSLGAPLPEEYASFAWPGAGDEGTRIVVGLEGGALLRFQKAGNFQYIVGGGGASPDAAFASPEEGWIVTPGGQDGAKVEQVSAGPQAPALGAEQAWPLPFRRPLLAIAPQPGTTPGESNAQALAVGEQGQIARYIPEEGWTPEFLYNGAGVVQTPTLRGIAWPEPNRAYAVGDEGAMWLWRSETGLWEPDPAAPLSFHANLTAIAFSPLDPAIGYAVGKQGTLLAYDKTWSRQAPPPGLEQANFTSIAFAGGQALATYRMVIANAKGEAEEVGGLIVNNGSGWEIDSSAQALLAELPNPSESVLSKVAGLPDGGAVAAGPGVVIERDSPSTSWRFSREPLPEAQNISALSAIRVGTEVRALVSIDLDPQSNPNNSEPGSILELDQVPPPISGQPFGLIAPDPPPVTGYLLHETAEGWQDLEQQAYPLARPLNSINLDLPNWPDAVLALDVDPSGGEGWAVGGQTGGLVDKSKRSGSQLVAQTAAALRLGPGPAPPQANGAPISTAAGESTFAVGGDAQCAGPCADLVNEGVGPEASLSHAISTAGSIPGLHAFLYTGSRIAEGAGRSLGAEEFTREMQAYGSDLSGAGILPVHVAPSPSDIDPAGGLSTFASVLGADAGEGAGFSKFSGTGAYAFDSPGNGGTVRVIVLDYSTSALAPGELGWLAEQLSLAKDEGPKSEGIPAIVMGSADIVKANAPNHAADAAAVEQVLLNDGASAYLFDSPGENRREQIGSSSNHIPAFGTGTLGYVPAPVRPEEFLGASGLLLLSVNVAGRNTATNRAEVNATLTPNISKLAIDPTDGTLLRRSQVALFQALARRPLGGVELLDDDSSAEELAPNPYVPIPEKCIGANCGAFLEPEYTFSSSDIETGNFVEPEPNSLNPRAVLQGSNGKPIADPHSGLFCAFNAGATTVSITVGGLTYSLRVTVQAGSAEQPCGTVPLNNPSTVAVSASAPVGAPPPSTPPASSPTPVSVTPPPLVLAPASVPPAPPIVGPPPPPFFVKPLTPVALVAVPLVPPPVLARPIPPSGAAEVAVFSPAVAPEEKREEEEAVESARNSMAIYDPEEKSPPPLPLIALIVIAAGTGAGIRRTRTSRRTRRAPELARARARRYDWMR
jgi:hypothetical protein